jgi:hypothetical protein
MQTIDEKLDAALAELKGLRADVAKLQATDDRNLKGTALLANHLGAAPRQASGSSSSGSAQPVPDDVLDSPGGDPEIRFEVKAWTKNGGDPMKGRKLSECPAPFLDLYAGAMDFSANDPEKARFREENVRGAQLARAWAARKRAGWRAPGEAPPQDDPPPPDEL